jgi:non-ribosomal peptide synthetase component E (peptide arylation enzyme)
MEFVKELPKTISGKIKRKELRTMEFEKKRDVIEKLKEKGLWLRSGYSPILHHRGINCGASLAVLASLFSKNELSNSLW